MFERNNLAGVPGGSEAEKIPGLDQESIEKILSVIKQQALWVSPRISVNILSRDPADNKFLECALESQADYLITGNTRHFPLKMFHGTRIITPRDFIDLIGKAIFSQLNSASTASTIRNSSRHGAGACGPAGF